MFVERKKCRFIICILRIRGRGKRFARQLAGLVACSVGMGEEWDMTNQSRSPLHPCMQILVSPCSISLLFLCINTTRVPIFLLPMVRVVYGTAIFVLFSVVVVEPRRQDEGRRLGAPDRLKTSVVVGG